MAVTLFLLAALVYGFYAVPDEIVTQSSKPTNVSFIYTLTYEDGLSLRRNKEDNKKDTYNVNVSFLNIMPVKNSSLKVSEREYVAISGELFGIRLFTEGVIVVGVDEVQTANGTVNPSGDAGLQKGDVILSIDSQKMRSCNQVSEIIEKSGGKAMKLQLRRKDKVFFTDFKAAYSETEGKYKAGIWIRDSAAGIGTMTFLDKETGMFASLGHGVCDIDTGEILPVYEGDIVGATVNGCSIGQRGKAGELCGVFSSESKGILYLNCQCGVYGKMNEKLTESKLYPVAFNDEVQKGKAQIISTVDETGPQVFDIEITKISKDNSEDKNLVIKVVDENLLSKTGGIVQGMSGSPIIQNGMLVGAVTHVFINDPTQGYAIFSRTMLSTMRSVQTELERAS
ncbi:MAG: SpoIVB peptidase [Clostridia bacterium]|nr:SpoIVB peptidase [Clostridia bacterium]